jgi:hypothetical protein
MKEQDELGRRIAKVLEEGTRALSAERRQQLADARKRALAHHKPQPAQVWAPAWAGYFSRFTERRIFGIRYLVPASVLILGLAGIGYMQTRGISGEAVDVELALLTDELPIRAYLDKGFDAWLKRSSR